MSKPPTKNSKSTKAEQTLARMNESLRKAVDAVISDPRFVSFSDHAMLLLAIAWTCHTKEEALALFKGAVKMVEDDDFPISEGVREADQTERYDVDPAEQSSDSAALTLESVGEDWRFLWSHFGDRAFCEKNWNQYVAVFMREIVGSGTTAEGARDAATETLRQRAITDIPLARFVVDFVGDA